jgi:hypothetical protein
MVMIAFACILVTGTTLVSQEPELSLSEAIDIALANNRPANIAKLDITKAEWQVAATKTKRLPSITAYFFGGGNLTTPTFTFNQGIFGTLNGKPNPTTDTKIPFSTGSMATPSTRSLSLSPSFTKLISSFTSRNSMPILRAKSIGGSASPWQPT